MSDQSSRRLLANYAAGESRAADAIVERYALRLVRLVAPRMSGRLKRRVDADDVVQSALRSFFVRAADEAYVLQRAGDLWRLLAAITLSKLRRQVEVHTAAKRAVGVECERGSRVDDEQYADTQPTAEEALELVDELERLLATCTDDERAALELRLAGETVESIAEQRKRSQRTVRRSLQTLRLRLEARLAELSAH